MSDDPEDDTEFMAWFAEVLLEAERQGFITSRMGDDGQIHYRRTDKPVPDDHFLGGVSKEGLQ
jgi:hypothetical protein